MNEFTNCHLRRTGSTFECDGEAMCEKGTAEILSLNAVIGILPLSRFPIYLKNFKCDLFEIRPYFTNI